MLLKRVLKGIKEEYNRLFSLPEMSELIQLFPESEAVVKNLKAKKYILGVLSNGTQKCKSSPLLSPPTPKYQEKINLNIIEALERDLGHLFSHFEFTVTEAKKPGTSTLPLFTLVLSR